MRREGDTGDRGVGSRRFAERHLLSGELTRWRTPKRLGDPQKARAPGGIRRCHATAATLQVGGHGTHTRAHTHATALRAHRRRQPAGAPVSTVRVTRSERLLLSARGQSGGVESGGGGMLVLLVLVVDVVLVLVLVAFFSVPLVNGFL